MKSTFLQWAHSIAAHTLESWSCYTKTEIWEPIFYKPKKTNEKREKEDYETAEVMKWAIEDANRNRYANKNFIKELFARYDAWRW